MARIDNTAFETKVNNGEYNAILNVTGVFRNASSTAEDCSAGFLCVRDGALPNEGYTGITNANAFYMKAAGSTDTKGIFACNPFGVNQAGGYKLGENTLGIPQYAGEADTYTAIDFDSGLCVYRFGAGNTSGTIGTNQYFTIANGLLATAATAPNTAGTPYFEIVGTGNFTEGSSAAFAYYDVRALRA